MWGIRSAQKHGSRFVKRIFIFLFGVMLGAWALWVGNQTGVSLPDNPNDLDDLLWQIYVGTSLATYTIAGLSLLGTLFLNVSYLVRLVREHEDVFTGNARVLWTMLIFAGGMYAYGAFATPLEHSLYPLDWFQLGGQWNFALALIVAPPLFLLRLFVLEVWARFFGKKHPVLAAAEDLSRRVDDLQQRVAALQGRLPSAADAQVNREWQAGVTQALSTLIKGISEMRKDDLPRIAADAKRAASAAPPAAPVEVRREDVDRKAA